MILFTPICVKIFYMINYSPFFETLEKEHITQYQLMKDYFIPSSTINRIKKNKSITLKSIETLCDVLGCKINDIVTFT